ncbi:peroxidase 5-like [Canna indica]|uniref:Peroxidase 5-like n=1 Tax=Canna indica TaxID=4628 RepID=A0AAQ3QT84_9LILI|nr:peroxidase 5-like [Canna indica]
MDPGTGSKDRFDNSYYQSLLKHKGFFTSDQTLLATLATSKKVQKFASNAVVFKSMFAPSMIKMGNIGVHTGSNGEIRANCRMAN